METATRASLRGVALGLAMVSAGCVGPGDFGESIEGVTNATLRPSSDVAAGTVSVVGVTNNTSGQRYLNVAEVTADDNTSYVRGTATTGSTSHEVGYSGAPSGTVTQVVVHVRAALGTSTAGSVALELFDGTTSLGTKPAHALTSAYTNYTDTWTGLTVSNGNNLRTEVHLTNAAGTGAVRYTQTYIDVTTNGGGTDAGGTDAGGTDAARDAGGTDAGGGDAGAGFPAGTICNNSGTARTPPATLRHVIVIMMENKSAGSVQGNANAPYFNSISRQCGYSTGFVDNMFGSTDLVSLPHYLALTSGSNCNSGLDGTGSGCITDDGDATSHRLSTQSIFAQVASWRAYDENMPSACDPSSSGGYAAKHNPAAYYSTLGTCSADDLPIAAVSCPTTLNTVCSTPSNAFSQDLANDTLAAFTFVTPNLTNDMHDGTVAQGDNWLHTYLPRIFASAAYLRGDTAVYVMWDEGSPNGAQPNLFISPYIQPTVSSATMNLFAVLRASETQLGIGTHLGCASGTIPGTGGACPAGSTADLRSVFNF